jgi:hypothetical protein
MFAGGAAFGWFGPKAHDPFEDPAGGLRGNLLGRGSDLSEDFHQADVLCQERAEGNWPRRCDRGC